MKKLLLTLMLSIVSSSVMAEWVVIDTELGDGSTYYANPNTIRKSGNKVKIWAMVDYNSVQQADGVKYLSSKYQHQFVCKEEQYRMLYFSMHSKNMGGGDIFYSVSKPVKNWRPVVPDSAIETLWKIVCGKENPFSSISTPWVSLGENGDKTLTNYVDPISIRKTGNIVKMWSLFDHKEILQQVGSIKIQNEYDCKKELFKALYTSFHTENMGRGNTILSDGKPGSWLPVPPGSNIQTHWEFACRERSFDVDGNVVAEWAGIGANAGITYYANPNTIRKSGNIVKMWSLLDYSSVQKISDDYKYLSAKLQYEYDCKEEQERRLYSSLHSENMGRGDVILINDKLVKNWSPVPPESGGFYLWKFACGK